MVVVVRKDGNLLPGEQVTFRASKGTLIGYTEESTDDPTDTPDSRTNVRVWAITDGRGQAEVTYFQEPGDGSDTVTDNGSISGTDPDYEREVVFGINGSCQAQLLVSRVNRVNRHSLQREPILSRLRYRKRLVRLVMR